MPLRLADMDVLQRMPRLKAAVIGLKSPKETALANALLGELAASTTNGLSRDSVDQLERLQGL